MELAGEVATVVPPRDGDHPREVILVSASDRLLPCSPLAARASGTRAGLSPLCQLLPECVFLGVIPSPREFAVIPSNPNSIRCNPLQGFGCRISWVRCRRGWCQISPRDTPLALPTASSYAERQLRHLGVQVRTFHPSLDACR